MEAGDQTAANLCNMICVGRHESRNWCKFYWWSRVVCRIYNDFYNRRLVCELFGEEDVGMKDRHGRLAPGLLPENSFLLFCFLF